MVASSRLREPLVSECAPRLTGDSEPKGLVFVVPGEGAARPGEATCDGASREDGLASGFPSGELWKPKSRPRGGQGIRIRSATCSPRGKLGHLSRQ